MKKFDGITVDSFIKSTKLSSKEKFKLIISFAEAVRKIQKLGICHSDLHTQNLLVSGDCHVEIIDFGNGILFDANTLTRHALTGTDFLRPPEYFKGPYCPVGVNAFQFARIAMNIWSGVAFENFWKLKDSYDDIGKIEKHETAAKFFKPIIELLKIKDPFERVVNSRLITKLR
jgi:serine/threonine protein kinase